jgi:hypothetical protein
VVLLLLRELAQRALPVEARVAWSYLGSSASSAKDEKGRRVLVGELESWLAIGFKSRLRHRFQSDSSHNCDEGQ